MLVWKAGSPVNVDLKGRAESSNYEKALEARAGIEPAHKGFADLFLSTITLANSIQTLNFALICDPFRVTPIAPAGAGTPPPLYPSGGWSSPHDRSTHENQKGIFRP